jgi:group I intron endonuclease
MKIIYREQYKFRDFLRRRATQKYIYIFLSGGWKVGSSSSNPRRLKEYFNINYLEFRKNMPICSALLKYGYSNFQLEILEYSTKNKVLIKEQYYLDLLKSEYNILTTAGSSLGYRHSPETIAKFKARKHSLETKAKIREKTQTAERIEQLKRLHADPEY